MPLIESISGVRGIYDNGLDENIALKYTYSYLSFLRKKQNKEELTVVIGTDTRPSKDILKNSVIEALSCNIIDIGIATTPMAEFAVRHFKADGGIIITASHNEPYWNGFKFLGNDGAVLRQNDMLKVIENYKKYKPINKKIKVEKNKKISKKTKKISRKYDEINKAYSDFVIGFLSKEDREKLKNANLRIIIDPNGGTGIIAKPILEKLGVKVHGINMKYGIFNRIIEPNESSLIYLANEVKDKNYDFAAGFDCDADRVEVVASNSIISGNQLLALIADSILKNAKNKIVVVNDATSSIVKKIAEKHKAKYVETETGEINVVDKIYALKAPIGGEGSSSGIIIPSSRCRDGILTLIYLLKIVANEKKTLEQLIKELPEFYNVKGKVEFSSKKYKKIRKKLIDFYSKKGFKIKSNGANGRLKAIKNDSFVWFRASKTESNILRIITDSDKKNDAQSLMDEALQVVKTAKDK